MWWPDIKAKRTHGSGCGLGLEGSWAERSKWNNNDLYKDEGCLPDCRETAFPFFSLPKDIVGKRLSADAERFPPAVACRFFKFYFAVCMIICNAVKTKQNNGADEVNCVNTHIGYCLGLRKSGQHGIILTFIYPFFQKRAII